MISRVHVESNGAPHALYCLQTERRSFAVYLTFTLLPPPHACSCRWCVCVRVNLSGGGGE